MYFYLILLLLPEYIPFSILFQFSPRLLLYPLSPVGAAHVHMGVGFPSLGQGNLCPTLLRKTHSFSLRGHRLPIIPQLQVELPASLLLPYWVGPACPIQVLCRGPQVLWVHGCSCSVISRSYNFKAIFLAMRLLQSLWCFFQKDPWALGMGKFRMVPFLVLDLVLFSSLIFKYLEHLCTVPGVALSHIILSSYCYDPLLYLPSSTQSFLNMLYSCCHVVFAQPLSSA